MKKWYLLTICFLILIGCSNEIKVSSNEHTRISIEPYSLSDKEESLLIHTGVSHIEFFHLNGELGKKDDLEFSLEVYKKGKFKENLSTMSNMVESKFKNRLLSFAFDQNMTEKKTNLKLIIAEPGGVMSTNYSNHITASSFGKLVDKRITLKKNRPVYLAAWSGTTENHLRSLSSKEGELPEGIKEIDEVILYRVVWKERTDNIVE